MVYTCLPSYSQEGEDYEIFWRMQKSFGAVSNQAITFDTVKFGAGYGLMFAYASFMLGKPNLVEQRVYLAGTGIVGVAMGVVIAMGLTMLMGFFYTPLHGVMVYLCLGNFIIESIQGVPSARGLGWIDIKLGVPVHHFAELPSRSCQSKFKSTHPNPRAEITPYPLPITYSLG